MCSAEFAFDPNTNEVNVSLFGVSGDQVATVAHGIGFLSNEGVLPFTVFEDGGEVEIKSKLGPGSEPRDVAVVLVAAEILPEKILEGDPQDDQFAQAS